MVVVDFIKRDLKNGEIDAKGSKKIETHSILLYELNSEILIVDPNNSNFSAHIIDR